MSCTCYGMITCKSPIKVMIAAHEMGTRLFDEHAHKFSRKDFTLPQLFSCLVLREHQKKSFRGVEALLADCSDLRNAIGLESTPDHNTLWRAFERLIKPSKMNRALDLTARLAISQGLDISGDSIKPSVLDSTCFESHHVSRHFEKRKRQSEKQQRQAESKKTQRKGRKQPAIDAGATRSGNCRSYRSPSPVRVI